MVKFILKKCISFILTLLLVAALAFFLFEIIPGDAALAKLGIEGTEESIEALREAMGYNKSLPERFVLWIGSAIQGDFGTSLQYTDKGVNELIGDRLPVTLWLAGLSMILIIVISIPIGILTSKKKNGIIDRITGWFMQICMAIPSFVLGMLLSLLFGVLIQLFIPGAYISPSENFGEFLSYMIFPAIAVAIPKIAITVRFMKSTIFRELSLDYVRTARAKGNTQSGILWKHVLKNTLLPLVTFIGLILTEVMAGSIIIEQVFNLPGMGRMLVTAISNRDFPVVQAVVIYIAVVVITVNFLIDVLYKCIDPRV